MTKDTERALEAIRPIAKELNIEVDANNRFLFCNGQAIGISCNSTYATIKEFLGYAMYWIGKKDVRYTIPRSLMQQIKEFWVPGNRVQEIRKMIQEGKL